MGDLDLSEFTTGVKRGGIQCWYQRMTATDEQRAKLDAALANYNISNRRISEVLTEWGVSSAKAGAVHNHRTGGCTCA